MWVRRTYALAFVMMACGSKDAPPPAPTAPAPTAPAVAADDEAAPIPAAPAFPDGTRSLELTRTVAVRLEPGDDAKQIGTIAVDTRVGWTRTADGKGCKKPWVEIAPRGWVCADYLAPSKKRAMGREVPMLERGEIVPGVYGKIVATNPVAYALQQPEKPKKKKPKRGPITSTAQAEPPAIEPTMIEDRPLVGSINVRQYGEITVDGKDYWKVSPRDNEYVLRSAISQHRPSVYGGARLGDDTGLGVPLAFVWPRGGMQSAYTMAKPNGGGVVRPTVRARTLVPILETQRDKADKPTAYRVAAGEWIRASDVRVFHAAPPPALLREGERWIDVDLDSQILVAYEGELPVYATLVSSGAKGTPTETGVYRMWVKRSEADMKGLSGEDPYSVATVPWTQFFSPEDDLALHTAYWHDKFGTPRSHGCVNLSPKDARWLYFWSDPQVPPGWTMAAGVVEAPGSIVRVRSAAEPAPPLRGYAIKVDEARRMNAPATGG
jgi:hypothetical protein